MQPFEPATPVICVASLLGAGLLVGIGGGAFPAPVLVASSVPVRVAVGTAAAVVLLIAITGKPEFMGAGWSAQRLPSLSLGYVNLASFAALLPTTRRYRYSPYPRERREAELLRS